ncbi:MAG: hypothetical protein J6Q94_09280 [Clostridia bacterium]|nr:hypothetical protein [Clostridia bacterium]
MSEYNMTHTGRELDDAINKVKSGYVLPTEIYNIYSNVSDLDITMGKTLNVDIQPSADYIKKADTNIYTSDFACGIYRPSSDTRISNVSITVGFKPKIFYMRQFEGINSTSTRYYILAMWMMLDNNYAYFAGKPDGSTNTVTGGPVALYLQDNPKTARSTHSNGTNNRFTATDNGVKGNGSSESTMYCASGKGFQWYAWG